MHRLSITYEQAGCNRGKSVARNVNKHRNEGDVRVQNVCFRVQVGHCPHSHSMAWPPLAGRADECSACVVTGEVMGLLELPC